MNNQLPQQHEDVTIFQSAYKGEVSVVQNYLKNSTKDINAVDQDQRTLLHWACSGRYVDLAEFLIQQKIDVDKQDESGWTALIIAASVGSLPLVQLLIRVASINLVTNQHRNALHYACSKAYFDIVQVLVENGIEVGKQDISGQTPLFRACVAGHSKTVEYLISKGVNIHHLDGNNDTALHIAIENEHVKLVNLGGDCNFVDSKWGRL
jgi:26S proteasome non-ATPase regulatory subunit 10